MQQRSSSSSFRSSSDEHRAINIGADQQQHTKRRRIFDEDSPEELPISHRIVIGRRDISRSRSSTAEKCIHLIPVIVLFCLFTLWWFSFPDGRITAIRQIHEQQPNSTRIDLTVLAVAASSPIPANNSQNLSGEDETYLHPASSPN
ncbi:hypothetical protein PHAVU_011G070400 [Phaseolus vulgaris]|uniref:Transmembrane protein n=1 Tax=Phaseolus vulgaris TaxID=3885 RepID=V7AFW9_PHAVU|nr:hypothetical protein PHAVU_011G070400g [Phaseolus vulgaris]ESW04145.1 hypothetical protein PHAVU_011G070400g [Phaseolus vulgaris]